MSAERLDPPESPCLPDYDTLGDRQYDDAVERELWAHDEQCWLCRGERFIRGEACVNCAGTGTVRTESER